MSGFDLAVYLAVLGGGGGVIIAWLLSRNPWPIGRHSDRNDLRGYLDVDAARAARERYERWRNGQAT